MKSCRVCLVEKDLTEFPKETRNLDGLSGTCKTCHAERKQRWQEINREKSRSQKAAYRERHPEKDRESKLTHYRKNKEVYNEAAKEYARRNPAWKASCCAKRRAQKKKAIPPWADLKAIKDFYLQAGELGLTVDHIIPLQNDLVCGLHVLENLQLLTLEENSSKSNKFDIEAW
jgi:hypothetical protein